MLRLAFSAKWLGALLLCLLLAGVFALLAQWQVTRSLVPNSDNEAWTEVRSVPLDEVAQVGKPFTFSEITKQRTKKILTEVELSLTPNPAQAVLIGDRLQLDGTKGYWLVMPATTERGTLITAVGFIANLKLAQHVLAEVKQTAMTQTIQVRGRYLPSEAPVQSVSADIFATLSVAQLINLDSVPGSVASDKYTGILAITDSKPFIKAKHLEPITIGLAKSDNQVNWLSAFYAIEWTVFAGFALFIWWRLLSDSYQKLAVVQNPNQLQ